MSLGDHYEGRHLKVWSFAERLGLIAWLHESMSRKKQSSRSASSPKVGEKLSSFSPYVGRPEKASIEQIAIKNLYSSSKTYINCWNRKNIGTWDATDLAIHHVKHHPYLHYLWRFFTSDNDLQCILYSTLYSERFQHKFCKSRRKFGKTLYRTMRMISRERVSCPGAAICQIISGLQ